MEQYKSTRKRYLQKITLNYQILTTMKHASYFSYNKKEMNNLLARWQVNILKLIY